MLQGAQDIDCRDSRSRLSRRLSEASAGTGSSSAAVRALKRLEACVRLWTAATLIEANNTASGGECAALKTFLYNPCLQRNMRLPGSLPDPAMVEACQNARERTRQRGASSLQGSGRVGGLAHANGGGDRNTTARGTCEPYVSAEGRHATGRCHCRGSKPASSLAPAGTCPRQATSLQAGSHKRDVAHCEPA